MQRVFIIRGFGKKSDSKGQETNFDDVQAQLIDPALKACGLAGGTTGEIVDAGNIRADMFALIVEADLVICDMTVHNANVFYELGIRHALRKKHTLLLKGDPSADSTPFDLSTDRYLKYPLASPKDALPQLIEKIRASLTSARETDSPIFLMLPKLSEADASQVKMVPLDFIEEVGRAEAAADKGWLRVIAQDLRGQRFQWEGLRRVAGAQWRLKDYAGARESWDAVREAQDNDVEACLALANVYERQFRVEKRPALLETSNQMIERVQASDRATATQKADALGLRGRNLKTLWRQRFEDEAAGPSALDKALDIRALQSYEAYQEAFEFDLNSFYPGVAALQMGHLLQKLSTHKGWPNLFKGDARAARRRAEDLQEELPALAQVVKASVRRACTHLPEKQRTWANIADADLLFLMQDEAMQAADPSALVQAYADAVPKNDQFAWDACAGQLMLFRQLGVRSAAVDAVMTAMGPISAPGKHVVEHLVVFAGHGIDKPNDPPRFPAAAESKAREQIALALQDLKKSLSEQQRLTVLASAAPGADLLAHELCAELEIPSRLCLPMPVEAVAARVFASADNWRSRFLKVAKRHESDALLLSDSDEVPRWLATRADINPWERGNRWVMELAQAWGADQITLLAFWDQQEDERTGGTAHMVRLAREAGNFEMSLIDSRKLL